MTLSASRSMMTLVPERVMKPLLPVVQGMERTFLPSMKTSRRWSLVEIFTTRDLPILNLPVRLLSSHRLLAVLRPPKSPFTDTFVPGFQYCLGRHMRWVPSSHPQDPSCSGLTSIVMAFSMAARLSLSTTS